MKKLIILATLLGLALSSIGCASGDQAQQRWMDAQNKRAEQAAAALQKLAENPRQHVLKLKQKEAGKPIVIDNADLEMVVAADGREIAEAAQELAKALPQPKTDAEVVGDTIKSLGSAAVNGAIAWKVSGDVKEVLVKGFDKAGTRSTVIQKDVGNTDLNGDLNSVAQTGDGSPASGVGATGPRDQTSIVEGGGE